MTDWRSVLQAFPKERTWLLPALHAVQHELRWVPAAALAEVAAHLRVPASEAYGVATHYPEFRLTEPRARLIRVCTGVPCRIRGGVELLASLRAVAGPDVTLEPFDCAFNCSVAPVVEVDGSCHGRVAREDVNRLLSSPAPRTLSSPESSPAPPVKDRSFAEIFRRAAGAAMEALTREVARRGLEAAVAAVGCNGTCWAAPMMTVATPESELHHLPHATADRLPALLDAVAARRLEPYPGITDVLRHQRRELTARCGDVEPDDIGDAIRRGSYATLAAALEARRPEAVIEVVKAAGLRGRGGAYFAAALKWEGTRGATRSPKYFIVNGEEGEPGIFKDRHLMEGDPHRLLEGALLAAYAAGAGHIYLYVHGEAHLAAKRVARAVEEARAWGLIGPRVLDSDFSVEVEVRRGAGGFVLGEETALMESLEGRRAMPRPKPPFPTEAGLFGKPTVINNVETLFAVP